jgi:WD40 repeat protein
MRHLGRFQQRAGRVGWRPVLASALLLAGGPGKQLCCAPLESFSAKPASAAAHVQPSQDHVPLAAAERFLQVAPAHAQRVLVAEPQARPLGQAQPAFADEFDQIVLREKGPQAWEAARIRLEPILAKKVAALDRIYHLSESQKQKLTLAGEGDISRLDGRINAGRKNYATSRRVENAGGGVIIWYAHNPELAALRSAVESGPFGEQSLFAKTQKTVLTTEQIKKEEGLQQLAAQSTKKISLDNVASLHTAGRFRLNAQRIAWRPDHNEVGLFEFDKALQLRAADDFRLLRTVGESHQVAGFDFSPRGDLVAIGDNSSKAFLVNLSSGKEIPLDTGNRQPSVRFSPDGKFLVTGGYGNRAILWSAQSGERLGNLETGPVTGGLTPVFSPDGKILAVGNRNNSSVCLFDVATRRLLRALPSEMSQELEFDPTGQRLAITHVNGKLSVWNVQSGKLHKLGRWTAEELYSVDWSPDGTLIATSGRNTWLTIWRADDLRILKEIEAPDWVPCVRFNPEGTRLVYAGGAATPGGERSIEVLAVP